MSCVPASSLASKINEGECELVDGKTLVLSLNILENSGAYPIVIDPFVASSYPSGSLPSSGALLLDIAGSNSNYFGAQVGLGNFHSDNVGYSDVVVSAPNYNNRAGTIYSYKNNGAAFSSTYTTELTSASSCSRGSYGMSMGVGRPSATTKFDSVYSGSSYCDTSTVWTGSSPNPTRTTSRTGNGDRCMFYAYGSKPICTTYYYVYNYNSFVIGTTKTSAPFNSITTKNPGLTVYSDYTSSRLFFSDPNADSSSTRWLGYVSATDASGSRVWGTFGSQPNAGFGRALGLADVNGNGSPDLLIGSCHFDFGTRTNVGAVFVYGDSGTTFASTSGFAWYGEQDNEECGSSIANAGDLNKDNFQDFVIGCPYYSSSSGLLDGRIVLISGGANFAATFTQSIYSGISNAFFGFSLPNMLRDMNNDNYNDIVVGMPGAGNFNGRIIGLKALKFSAVSVTIGSNRGTNVISTSITDFTVVVTLTNSGPEPTDPNLGLVFTFPAGFPASTAVVSSGLTFSTATAAAVGASIPVGTTVTFTLKYTLDNTVIYPSAVSFSVKTVTSPKILISNTASVIFSITNPVTVVFSSPNTIRPIAFQQLDNAADTSVPACIALTGTNACAVPKERVVVVRRFSITNNGPATAFANQITIGYPVGVNFGGIRLISTRALANLTTLGWSCSEPRARTTVCVFPNLASGQQQNTEPYELFFTTPGLTQVGNWQFSFTYTTSSTLSTPLTANSNQLYAPINSCDVTMLPANTAILQGGSCCGGASTQICSGDTVSVVMYATNAGYYASASTVIRVTASSSAVSFVGVPIIFYDGASGTSSNLCTQTNSTSYSCAVPGGNIDPNRLAYVRVTLSLPSNTASNVAVALFGTVSTSTTQTVTNNDVASTVFTTCQKSNFKVQLDLLSNAATYTPTAKPVYQVTLTNNGPSDYATATGTKFRFTYGAGLTTAVPFNAVCDPPSGNTIDCKLPSIARASSTSVTTTVALASTDLSSSGYALTINSTVAILTTTAFSSRVVTFQDGVNTAVSLSVTPSGSVTTDNVVVISVDVKNYHLSNNATNMVLSVTLPYAIASVTSALFTAPSTATQTCVSTFAPDFTDFQSYRAWNVTCTIPLLTPSTGGCTNSVNQRCLYTLTIIAKTITAATLTASVYKDVTSWPFTAQISGQKPDTTTSKSASKSIDMTTRPDLGVVLKPQFSGNQMALNEIYTFLTTITNNGYTTTTATINITLSGNAKFSATPSVSGLLTCTPSAASSKIFTCSVANFARLSAQSVTFSVQTNGAAVNDIIDLQVEATSSVAESPTTIFDNVKVQEYKVLNPTVDLVVNARTEPRNPYVKSNYKLSIQIQNIGIATARDMTLKGLQWPNNLLDRNSLVFSSAYISTCTIPAVTGLTTLNCKLNATLPPSGIILVDLSVNTTATNGSAVFAMNVTDTAPELIFDNNAVTVYMTTTVRETTKNSGSTSSSQDSGSLIAAIVVPIVGCIIIGLILWKTGFFKRKEKPPALDGSGNPKVHDDD